MTTVYVVRCGNNIERIFSNKEKAEDYIKAPNLLFKTHEDSEYIDYCNLIPEEELYIVEYAVDSPEPYLNLKDLVDYWECKVTTTKSRYSDREEGDYSIQKKVIAKEDLPKLHSYAQEVLYFINNSTISELDAIETSYNDYLSHLKKQNKKDNVNWKRVECSKTCE